MYKLLLDALISALAAGKESRFSLYVSSNRPFPLLILLMGGHLLYLPQIPDETGLVWELVTR